MKRLRVAIAAGDFEIIQRIGSRLPSVQFEVFGVQRMDRALSLLKKHQLPLVLCDRSLIAGDGLTLLRTLAAGPRRHSGLRFLIHQEGDEIPSRGENNVLLYHDVLDLQDPAPQTILLSWIDNPNRSPDSRCVIGRRGAVRPPLLENTPIGPARPVSGGLTDPVRGLLEELRVRSQTHPEMTYWEILGVSPDCDRSELTAAFDAISFRFHPDRNTGIRSPDVKRILNEVYATVSEAYDILTHPDKARFYRETVNKGELRFDESAYREQSRGLTTLTEVPAAQRYLEHAENALEAGDVRGATMNLKFALKLDPRNTQLIDALAKLSG